ncbi:CLUMA_CG004835, isoform A [Clunio marinus]|uniref:CLUMA_CG004835, isoform A n=1 Tax=Clunio marinus TaxID=568069 RepID=A0A1J1HT22_9DIPT|nr:CLUMA_CG004835, isoform A [Clunio marinus]
MLNNLFEPSQSTANPRRRSVVESVEEIPSLRKVEVEVLKTREILIVLQEVEAIDSFLSSQQKRIHNCNCV